MDPPGRRTARHVRDSSIPLTVDGTARRVPGKGPGTGSGRVGRRAAVLPGFVYFVSIRTVPPVPRGPVGKVYRAVREARKTLICFKQISQGKGLTNPPPMWVWPVDTCCVARWFTAIPYKGWPTPRTKTKAICAIHTHAWHMSRSSPTPRSMQRPHGRPCRQRRRCAPCILQPARPRAAASRDPHSHTEHK